MAKSFEDTVGAFAEKGKNNLLAVVRDSISTTVETAQTPVKKGGKMRVDTGFLRSSGVAALNEMPVGPTVGRDRKKGESGELSDYRMSGSVMGESLNLVLAKMKLGDTIFFGWTARYAKIRETYDGFLESALQNWKNTVNASIRKIER